MVTGLARMKKSKYQKLAVGGDEMNSISMRQTNTLRHKELISMGKVNIVALLLVVTLLLFFMPLGGAEAAEEKMTDIKIVSASVGTGTYVNIVAMSAMLAANSKWLRATPIPTPGWIDALRMVRNERADIAGTGAIYIRAMMKGTQKFKGQKYEGLRWLWPFTYPRTQVVTKLGSPFRTMQDLRNARVGINPPGTGGEVDARALFTALGFTPKIRYLSYSDMPSALKDGTVNVLIAPYTIGAPGMVELATINDLYYIPLDDETWSKLEALELGYVRLPLPAGTYRLQDKEVLCQSKGGYMVATERLSDEIVYEVCKCFWDKFDKTITLNPKVLGDCKKAVESALNVPGPSPMHPGAIKYFKEKGMLK